jgi:hypothetical protein
LTRQLRLKERSTDDGEVRCADLPATRVAHGHAARTPVNYSGGELPGRKVDGRR